jgi:hypothetical protein
MTSPLLTLRISRRAIGVVALSDESLTFVDGRHLSSRSDRTVVAATKYVAKLIEVTQPRYLAVDVPARVAGRTTDRILSSLETLAAARGVSVIPLAKRELLIAFGIRSLRNRQELRDVVRPFWPELANVRGRVEPYIVDAAAAAIYADCLLSLEARAPT